MSEEDFVLPLDDRARGWIERAVASAVDATFHVRDVRIFLDGQELVRRIHRPDDEWWKRGC